MSMCIHKAKFHRFLIRLCMGTRKCCLSKAHARILVFNNTWGHIYLFHIIFGYFLLRDYTKYNTYICINVDNFDWCEILMYSAVTLRYLRVSPLCKKNGWIPCGIFFHSPDVHIGQLETGIKAWLKPFVLQ